jgi:hypothetical protein
MKRALLRVSRELLEHLLQFPEGVRIIRVVPPSEQYFNPRHAVFIVEGDELPVEDIEEGCMIPEVEGICTEVEHKTVPKVAVHFEPYGTVVS